MSLSRQVYVDKRLFSNNNQTELKIALCVRVYATVYSERFRAESIKVVTLEFEFPAKTVFANNSKNANFRVRF